MVLHEIIVYIIYNIILFNSYQYINIYFYIVVQCDLKRITVLVIYQIVIVKIQLNHIKKIKNCMLRCGVM